MLSWIVISTTLAVLFGVSNQKLADEEQLLTAKKLSADNDPLLEFLFTDLRKALLSDSVLSQLIFSQDIEDQYLNTYIRENYITGYISKYETEITTCFTNQELVLQPENRKVNCIDYFRSLVAMRGKELIPNDLFLINNNLLGVHYVGYLPFKDKKNTQSDSLNLFIEFYYKYIPEGTGYPDLLIDASKGIGPNLNKYSFASYRDGSLYYKFGSYFFPLRLEQMTNKTEGYFNRDGYRHAVLMFADKVLLISRKENNWAETMAPFSFFLLFNGFILLLLVLLQNGLPDFRKAFSTFRTRLQLIISVSLLSSFAMIGVITTIYMAEIYKKKNDDFLAEKTQSLLVELEHKLKDIPWGSLAKRDYLNQLLLKFSLVFFTDINLYDSDGRLMATSRPEIFKLRLTGEMMHPEAFRALHFQNRLYLRQYEEIGNARFISAYAPFKNSNGDAIAYINLPYFVKETEMQREVRSMVLSYLNLFLLLSAFSLLFALFVSRRLTKPLQMIQQKMSRVQLGDSNEKIQYQGYDEIGELVKQYNTLLDQLAISAELLARSERESAWREMARQVAHEIKNPLTPMRLSVQYLLKAWNDRDPDIDMKLKNISQTLISQIDTLSSIASAFSDFAVMPQPKPIILNLSQLLSKVVNLFDHQDNITFELSVDTTSPALVEADPENLNRIFTNLIKNSIQAIGNKHDAYIRLYLEETEDNYFVRIEDTGKGMTDEEAKKVFTPNFTTKSSGMGMGLSIVYSLVQQIGGSIIFETKPGEGTTFIIGLPKAKNPS
jgi:signal transduction histidine kinase